MKDADFNELVQTLNGLSVERPNKVGSGTLSGHAAGEPFEKLIYHILKKKFPSEVFKQFEYLNDLYRANPHNISVEDRKALFDSPTALFLLSRGDNATREWSPENIFEEKQDDTADILCREGKVFDIIDVKTRNMSKTAMPPNIISAYKLAQACAIMIDNEDYESINIHYIEVEWFEENNVLTCLEAHWRDLFRSTPESLYINWAAAMQVQFHVSLLNQSFTGTREQWAREYLRVFVNSAERRCKRMYETYVIPFKKYITEENSLFSE